MFQRRLPALGSAAARRGAVLVLSAFLMVVLLGVLALSIDVGYICLARGQLQNAADAAAMAAAWELLDENRLRGADHAAEVATQARLVAVDYARRHWSAGHDTALDENTDNHPAGDILLGTIDSAGNFVATDDPAQYTAVKVRARRTAEHHGPLQLFFAPTIGRATSDVTVEAVAGMGSSVVGFRADERTGRTKIMPFTIHVDQWNHLLAGGGVDEWFYDDQRQHVKPGADGVREIEIFPYGTGAAGNFGTLNFGDANNSTAVLGEQIRDGLSQRDLRDFGGQLSLENGPLQVLGDPGISGGMKHALADVVGEGRIILLHDHVRGVGAGAEFRIVGFAGVRVVDFFLDGKNEKRYFISVQPALVVEDSVITGTSGGYNVFTPVRLLQ